MKLDKPVQKVVLKRLMFSQILFEGRLTGKSILGCGGKNSSLTQKIALNIS